PISTPQSRTSWISPNLWTAARFLGENPHNVRCGSGMRFFIATLILASALSGQTTAVPAEPIRAAVGRLSLDRFKSHIKGLTQFGDRLQGTERNRKAIDWLEQQLKAFGYTNVQ